MDILDIKGKKKGNVSVMVILILLACSLMGILTVIFLNSLISYTDDSYGFYKSYYTAKAGLELALTQIDNSDMGFSQEIMTGDAININNFDCFGCHFKSKLIGKSNYISNNFWVSSECNDDSAFSLQEGESMTLPMFYDNTQNFEQLISYSKCLSGNECENLFNDMDKLELVSNQNLNPKLNVGVVLLSGEDVSREYLFMTGITMTSAFFQNYKQAFQSYYGNDLPKQNIPYLVLSNPNEQEVKFCIKTSDDSSLLRPTTKYFVSSVGEYMGKTVGLQAIYEQPVPSFLINPYSQISTTTYNQNSFDF